MFSSLIYVFRYYLHNPIKSILLNILPTTINIILILKKNTFFKFPIVESICMGISLLHYIYFMYYLIGSRIVILYSSLRIKNTVEVQQQLESFESILYNPVLHSACISLMVAFHFGISKLINQDETGNDKF